MKNSKHYAQEIKKLFRSLKRKESRVRPRSFDDPIDAIVYAVVSEHASRADASKIVKAFHEHFVDVNDLRVSRSEEILEITGSTEMWAKKLARALPRALNAVFNTYDGLSIAPLTDMGKRQARKALADLEGVSRFVADYVFLVVLGGHALPLTQSMLTYLRDNEMVNPEADDQDVIGFLERQISAADAYGFYSLLRRHVESAPKSRPKRKKKK